MPEAEADPGHTLILLPETMIMSNDPPAEKNWSH